MRAEIRPDIAIMLKDAGLVPDVMPGELYHLYLYDEQGNPRNAVYPEPVKIGTVSDGRCLVSDSLIRWGMAIEELLQDYVWAPTRSQLEDWVSRHWGISPNEYKTEDIRIRLGDHGMATLVALVRGGQALGCCISMTGGYTNALAGAVIAALNLNPDLSRGA